MTKKAGKAAEPSMRRQLSPSAERRVSTATISLAQSLRLTGDSSVGRVGDLVESE